MLRSSLNRAYRGLSFSEDGSRLLMFVNDLKGHGTGAEAFARFDTATGERVTPPWNERDAVLSAVLDGAGDERQRFFHAALGNTKLIQDYGERVALAPDRSFLADVTSTDGIRFQTIDDAAPERWIGREEADLLSVAIHPDGERLATGDAKGVLKIRSVATGEEFARLEGHEGEVFSVSFHPDGTHLASGANDGNVILWDCETFEPVLTLHGHQSYVHSVSFSPDGTMLASVSGDGTLRVWDSVSPAERRQRIGRDTALRREAAPLVARWIAELGDRLAVAERIRDDETLTAELQRAALRVLGER